MQQFNMSDDEVNSICQQYPKLEKIAEMKAHYEANSPFKVLAEFLIEFAADMKSSLPAPSTAQSEANEPSSMAPARKAR